jgi:GxxExxY protein
MPIEISHPVRVLDQVAFHLVDEVVTGLSFGIHNEFGRYLDERLYQAELERRMREVGIETVRETRLTVSFESFAKDYYVDFLVDGGVLVETKTVETLSPAHRAQLLNYLFLSGLKHGTLLNFRSERVQREFVSTTLDHQARRSVRLEALAWTPLSEACHVVRETMQRVLPDWGAGLDPSLYRDLITHRLGGEGSVITKIPVFSGVVELGMQSVHLLEPDIAFSVTASLHRPKQVEEHHRRFLRHTGLRAMQWINLNRQTVTFTTLMR